MHFCGGNISGIQNNNMAGMRTFFLVLFLTIFNELMKLAM